MDIIDLERDTVANKEGCRLWLGYVDKTGYGKIGNLSGT